jgi:hypothetical protein
MKTILVSISAVFIFVPAAYGQSCSLAPCGYGDKMSCSQAYAIQQQCRAAQRPPGGSGGSGLGPRNITEDDPSVDSRSRRRKGSSAE